MNDKPHEEHKAHSDHHEIDFYGDPGITSAHNPIPGWLIATYIILPIWGIICFALFWNGSHGWLDRGYWSALEKAANTTYPIQSTPKQ